MRPVCRSVSHIFTSKASTLLPKLLTGHLDHCPCPPALLRFASPTFPLWTDSCIWQCIVRWTIYSESAYFCLKRWLNHEVLWDKRGKIFLWLKTTANHRLHLTSSDEKIPLDEKLMKNVLLPDWACFQFSLERRINTGVRKLKRNKILK